MDTEQISYRNVVAEVKKYRIRALFISVTVWVTFMVIILFIREMKIDFFACAVSAALLLVPLFGGIIPLLQTSGKLKKIQQTLHAETEADMDALLADSVRLHPLCFLTAEYLISYQMMFVCALSEIRCIQMSDSMESSGYTIRVQCGGLTSDYLNYRSEEERDAAFRALMNAVPETCKVKKGLTDLR